MISLFIEFFPKWEKVALFFFLFFFLFSFYSISLFQIYIPYLYSISLFHIYFLFCFFSLYS